MTTRGQLLFFGLGHTTDNKGDPAGMRTQLHMETRTARYAFPAGGICEKSTAAHLPILATGTTWNLGIYLFIFGLVLLFVNPLRTIFKCCIVFLKDTHTESRPCVMDN